MAVSARIKQTEGPTTKGGSPVELSGSKRAATPVGVDEIVSSAWRHAAVPCSGTALEIAIQGEDRYQVTSLRTNSASGQWLDIQKAAMSGGQITNNPIYTGALGEYNGVILRQSQDVTNGVSGATGLAITTVRRAVLLGAQAAVVGYGQANYGPTKYRWNEELLDHKRLLEVSAWSIWGLKKTVFASSDFGTVVVSTYATASS